MMHGKRRVIVVGGGAGGMMAAGRAAELGAQVILLEKTRRLGQKILISGKTRCNLTNARDLEDFISMYGPNGRFLYRAFQALLSRRLDRLFKALRCGDENRTGREDLPGFR